MSYSATQLAKKLDISRSYLYYLKDNGVVEVEINDNGRVIWNEEAYQKLSEYIKKNKVGSSVDSKETPKEYKTTKIVDIWGINISYFHLLQEWLKMNVKI